MDLSDLSDLSDQGDYWKGQKGHLLGHGTYGQVWLYTTNEGKEYAIKEYDSKCPIAEGDISASFIAEVNVTGHIKHPNLLHHEAILWHQEHINLVLPLALCDLLEAEIDDFAKYRAHYFYQMARAVHYLHSCNILHGDIKPANFLLFDSADKEGNWAWYQLKLADFGLSQYGLLTRYLPEYLLYTITYRPPECHFDLEVDLKADVWALGAVLAELAGVMIVQTIIDRNAMHDICQMLGTPTVQEWPQFHELHDLYNIPHYDKTWQANLFDDPLLFDLLSHMLTLNPEQRPSMAEVCAHPYFESVRPSIDNQMPAPVIRSVIDQLEFDLVRPKYLIDLSDIQERYFEGLPLFQVNIALALWSITNSSSFPLYSESEILCTIVCIVADASIKDYRELIMLRRLWLESINYHTYGTTLFDLVMYHCQHWSYRQQKILQILITLTWTDFELYLAPAHDLVTALLRYMLGNDPTLTIDTHLEVSTRPVKILVIKIAQLVVRILDQPFDNNYFEKLRRKYLKLMVGS